MYGHLASLFSRECGISREARTALAMENLVSTAIYSRAHARTSGVIQSYQRIGVAPSEPLSFDEYFFFIFLHCARGRG